MRRFSWEEMRRYWGAHAARWADLDFTRDPEGLANVCHPGAPLWLNRHYARGQLRAFTRLLGRVPAPQPGARALDVGCGAGRWSRLLDERGYDTTGIDLQEPLLARNRARFPHIRFVHGAVQDLVDDPFDLVCSVTVIQHVPYDEQELVVARLRALTKPGAHVLALENLRDRDPHVFARSEDGWRELFEDAGFRAIAVRRYDYNPFLRATDAVRRQLARALGRSEAAPDPEAAVARTGRPDRAARVARAAKRVAAALDSVADPAITALGPPGSVHAGFLFRAPGTM